MHQRQTQIGTRESGMIPEASSNKAHWNAKQQNEDGSVDILCSECGYEVNLPKGKTTSPELCRGCKSRMTNWSGLPINFMQVTGEHQSPNPVELAAETPSHLGHHTGAPCHDFQRASQPTESGEFPINPS